MELTKIGVGLMMAVVISSPLRAQELKIIDVRRNIPLSDDEGHFKDFYINGGTKEGLKPNLVVTAVRKSTVRDASGMTTLGELSIPVGQLRIIFVQEGLAVAREHKLLSRDELPMIEQIGIMGGDLVDLKGSFVEKRKPNAVPSPTAATGLPAASPTAASPGPALPAAAPAVAPAAAPEAALPAPIPVPAGSPVTAAPMTPPGTPVSLVAVPIPGPATTPLNQTRN